MEYIILDPYLSPAWLNSSVPESAWGFIFMDSTASFVAISSGMRGLLCSLALQPTLHAMNNIIVMRPEFFTKLFKPGSSSNFILVVYQAEVYFSIKPIIFIRLVTCFCPFHSFVLFLTCKVILDLFQSFKMWFQLPQHFRFIGLYLILEKHVMRVILKRHYRLV